MIQKNMKILISIIICLIILLISIIVWKIFTLRNEMPKQREETSSAENIDDLGIYCDNLKDFLEMEHNFIFYNLPNKDIEGNLTGKMTYIGMGDTEKISMMLTSDQKSILSSVLASVKLTKIKSTDNQNLMIIENILHLVFPTWDEDSIKMWLRHIYDETQYSKEDNYRTYVKDNKIISIQYIYGSPSDYYENTIIFKLQ